MGSDSFGGWKRFKHRLKYRALGFRFTEVDDGKAVIVRFPWWIPTPAMRKAADNALADLAVTDPRYLADVTIGHRYMRVQIKADDE